MDAATLDLPACAGRETRRWWMRSAEDLLRPLVALMEPGASDLPLRGPASNHGAQADRLESFARPCLLAAHWLAAEPDGEETLAREPVAAWFREGLVAGADPARPGTWGPAANFHQHTVEMGALVLALEMAGDWLWEPLTGAERALVAAWMGSVRGVGLHRNNHLFFGVLPLCFLDGKGLGRPGDRALIARWMDALEAMHLGGGWFIDGMNETVDHYNAYAFHYYGLWWGRLYGALDPGRAERWRDWASAFLPDYAFFFAASGELVPFGRSLAYRFAASAPFGLAAACGVSAVDPGLARRLCTRSLHFFLDRAPLQEQGALSLGWTDTFPPLAEAYSCAGSPYWAAKGFAPLLLPADHAFWTAEERPLPAEENDFALPVPQAGLVVRGDAGEVELLNAGVAICGGNTGFGVYKWGRLSVRTGLGWETPGPDGRPPWDALLAAEVRDGTVFIRHSTHPLAVERDHMACVYSLGDRFSHCSVQVETHLWWRAGWHLHLHRCRAWQPARLILGGYSLAADRAESLAVDGAFPFVVGENGTWFVGLQAVAGFCRSDCRTAGSGGHPRTHLSGPCSMTLALTTDWIDGAVDLVALTTVGKRKPVPWTLIASAPGELTLESASGETWTVRHPALPSLILS